MSAKDKATSKAQSITVNADGLHRSKEELDEMIRKAEEMQEEDEMVRRSIDARLKLEGYAHNMLQQVSDDDKLATKIKPEEKESVTNACQKTLKWLDEHEEATLDEYQAQQKELQDVCQPIVQHLYQQHGSDSGEEPTEDGDEDHEDL